MYFRLKTTNEYGQKIDYIFLYLGRITDKFKKEEELNLIYVVKDNSNDDTSWAGRLLSISISWDLCELVEDLVLELLED